MSTEAAPEAPALPQSDLSQQADAAQSPAATPQHVSRRERMMGAFKRAQAPEPEAPKTDVPDTAATSAADAAKTPDPAKPSLEDRIAARLQAQRDAREAAEAKKRQDELNRAILERASINEQTYSKRASSDLAEAFRRDPVAALRSLDIDPRAALEMLTKEALNPGASRAAFDAESGRNAAADVEKRLHELEARLQQEAQSKAMEEAIRRDQESFVTSTGDQSKFPLLSKLPSDVRLRQGQHAWAVLQAQGMEYDEETVAEFAEQHLATISKAWQPAAAERPTHPQAAEKKKTSTITPQLVGDRGETTKHLSRAERRKRMHAKFERLLAGSDQQE